MPSASRSTQLLIAVVAAAAMVVGGCRKREAGPSGDIVATLTAKTLDGAAFDPQTLRGKRALVMFVSPTCPHCIDQLPVAQQVAKRAGANAVAVFIVGKAENARGVIEHTQFEGPALIDDGSLRQRYGVRAVPYTLVLGADGHAREQLRGAHDASTLEDALDAAR